jgi:hypothetical protein
MVGASIRNVEDAATDTSDVEVQVVGQDAVTIHLFTSAAMDAMDSPWIGVAAISASALLIAAGVWVVRRRTTSSEYSAPDSAAAVDEDSITSTSEEAVEEATESSGLVTMLDGKAPLSASC